jgi:hypothetical protein
MRTKHSHFHIFSYVAIFKGLAVGLIGRAVLLRERRQAENRPSRDLTGKHPDLAASPLQ